MEIYSDNLKEGLSLVCCLMASLSHYLGCVQLKCIKVCEIWEYIRLEIDHRLVIGCSFVSVGVNWVSISVHVDCFQAVIELLSLAEFTFEGGAVKEATSFSPEGCVCAIFV